MVIHATDATVANFAVMSVLWFVLLTLDAKFLPRKGGDVPRYATGIGKGRFGMAGQGQYGRCPNDGRQCRLDSVQDTKEIEIDDPNATRQETTNFVVPIPPNTRLVGGAKGAVGLEVVECLVVVVWNTLCCSQGRPPIVRPTGTAGQQQWRPLSVMAVLSARHARMYGVIKNKKTATPPKPNPLLCQILSCGVENIDQSCEVDDD